MTSNRLGMHWIRSHPDDQRDFDFVRRIQPASIKLFEPGWGDYDFCRALLDAAPLDCIFLARNHPLSEQHDDMWRDPVGTGRRHADDWNEKVQRGRCWLPVSRTYFLGINEPNATTGDRLAIDLYTVAFLDGLRMHGLKGGAFNFSTGHPRTVDGSGNTAPDYDFFERSHQAIVRGGHIAVQHIYGSAEQPLVPGHFDRLRSCHWQDVTWVIGECGIDQHVTTGGRHDGYLAALKPPTSYPQWMEHAMRGANDPRIHSWQPFTYDFSHPWSSFDVREVDEAFVAWGWKGFDPAPIVPIPPDPTPEPPDPTPVPGKFVHPLPHGSYSITQRFNETETNPNGHEGTDFGAAGGTPVICLTDGIVAFTGVDADYGNYVRVYHDACKLHSFYAHMSRIDVHQGEAVQAGMVLGAVGSTGNSTGPHLHFETRLGNASVYSDAAPKAKGRCDPESVCAMFGLNLATGELEEIAQAQVWLPIVTTY